MRPAADRPANPAVAVAVGVLIAAGVAEIVGSVIELADGGAMSVAAHSQPTSLLPLTLVVLIAGFGSRPLRITAFFCAGAALITRVVFASLLIVPGWNLGTASSVSVAAGLLTGAGVLAFSLLQVLRHRDLSEEQPQAENEGADMPVASPPASNPARPVHQSHRIPVSPSTPVDTSRQSHATRTAASWATTSTPWPRADEGDPNGTLIRPPRR